MKNGRLVSGGLLFLTMFILFACSNENPQRIISHKYLDPIIKARKEVIVQKSMDFIPGLSIAVSVDNKLVWSEGMGYASENLEVPASRETKYRIGDISEIFTALSYNMLVNKGILQPDSSIQHYIPDFPVKKWKITLRNLVDHSSGIRIATETELHEANYWLTIQRGLTKFMSDSLQFKPGYIQQKSIYNYILLGAAIERAVNEDFSKVVDKLVIDTLGLKNTVPDNTFIVIKGKSDFFDHNYISQVINATSIDLQYSLPANGFLSTAEDLNKLGNAFIYPGCISDSLKAQTFRSDKFESHAPARWVNGWFISSDKSGKKIYACNSKIVGSGSSLLIYPADKLVVAVTTNLTDKYGGMDIFKIAQYFIDFIDQKK